MTVHHGTSRKEQGGRTPTRGSHASSTIRVAVRVAPVEPPPPKVEPRAAAEEAAETSALPCSGRCGHCDCHPCRLHMSV